MKPHILIAIFCLIPLFCHGQVFVGNVNINDNDTINVIEVLVDRRGSRKSIEVFVDFGQKDNSNSNSVGVKSDDLLITNPQNKKKVTFRSTAAVLNFLEKTTGSITIVSP